MKFIGHVLAFLLTLVITITAWSFVLSRTLGSPAYLERAADQSGLYQSLSTSIPDADINPSVLRDQVQAVLPAFIDHLTKGTPAPTFTPPGGQPQTLNLGTGDDTISHTFKAIQPATFLAPVLVVVLVLLILFTMRAERLPVLARTTLQSAFSLGLSAALMWFTPTIVLSLLNQPGAAPLKTALAPFLTTALHGVALQLGLIALALLLVSVALRLVNAAGKLKNRFIKPTKQPKPKIPPAPGALRQ